MLSPRFALRTGFVFDGPAHVSRQGDILIVDENDPAPYLFRKGNFAVVHPRAFTGVIEVKTSLNKDSFGDAMENLRSFRLACSAAGLGYRPGTMLFCFDSPEFSNELLGEWHRASTVPDAVESYPNVVFSLNAGLITPEVGKDGANNGHLIMHEIPRPIARGRALSVFLMTVRKVAELKAGIHANPFEFAAFDGFKTTTDRFRFGKGLCARGG
jgi:hypothetical protein